MYVQREIWFSAEFGDISYQRAIELLQKTIYYALADNETGSVKDELNDVLLDMKMYFLRRKSNESL